MKFLWLKILIILNSANKIRSDYAQKIRHIWFPHSLVSEESEASSDETILGINDENWKEIKTVFVNSLNKLDPENLSLANKKSEEALKRYQTSQKSTSKKINQEIIKLSKDESFMEATCEFYEDGWQFDVAKDDYIQSSNILKKASENKGKELYFFFGENTTYTEQMFVLKTQWKNFILSLNGMNQNMNHLVSIMLKK